jgi:hypothetical protein
VLGVLTIALHASLPPASASQAEVGISKRELRARAIDDLALKTVKNKKVRGSDETYEDAVVSAWDACRMMGGTLDYEWSVARPAQSKLLDRFRIVTLTYRSKSCDIDKAAQWRFERWTRSVKPLNDTARAFGGASRWRLRVGKETE